MHFALLAHLSDLVCLIDTPFFDDDVLKRAADLRVQRVRSTKGSDEHISSLEDTGCILNFPLVTIITGE
jgi:hypothetical protein